MRDGASRFIRICLPAVAALAQPGCGAGGGEGLTDRDAAAEADRGAGDVQAGDEPGNAEPGDGTARDLPREDGGVDGELHGGEEGDGGGDRVEEPLLPPIRDDALGVWAPYEQAPLAIDGYFLPDFFRDAGYAPPEESEILVGRVVEGVGGPAYQLYDMSGSAFSTDFWPASAIKLLAALGALDFMGTLGMTGDAVVTISYGDGAVFSRRVRNIYGPAVRVSSNPDYDRCVEVAGFDRLNEVFLSPAHDLPTTVIQRRYGGSGNLRTSPEMAFVEGGRTRTVPERVGTGDFGCPPEGNCTNLFEILHALTRTVLHDELPDAERFVLEPSDVEELARALLEADSYFQGGAEAVLGSGALVYNKTGFVPGDDILDHGLVVDPATGDRYLAAASVPETTSSRGELSDFVEQALFAVFLEDPEGHMPWQRDAGVSMRAQLDDEGLEGGRRRIHFTVDAPGADRLRLWTDTWLLGETRGGPRFELTYDYSHGGERLLVIEAFSGDDAVGYRAMPVFIPPP